MNFQSDKLVAFKSKKLKMYVYACNVAEKN